MIRADELTSGLGALLLQQIGEAPRGFRAVRIDSREVRSGDLFVALAGEHHDGHEFLNDAVAKGTRGLLAQRPPAVPAPGVVTYVVSDTLQALQAIAGGHRRRLPVKVIGVTGSVGKTTTKEMTASILRRRYRVLKNEANFNNEIGLPLTLLQLTARHERAVLEMGMYAIGEIRLLCELAQPEVGVVTNVGPVHLERLGSIEAIAAAKAELVEALPKEGVAVLNGDDPLVKAMAEKTRARVLLYGTSADCEVRGTDLESHGLRGIAFTLVCGRHRVRVRTRLPGRHLLYNALAAAAVGVLEGMAPDELAEALSKARVPLRLHVYRGRNDSTILDDTYNASPASMLAALELLADLPGRRIAVLGDMRELGAEEKEGHRIVGREAAQVAQVIYAIGELGHLIGEEAQKAGHPAVSLWSSKEEAAQHLAHNLAVGDVVLLKGSRAMALETMLKELKG
ncbi:MAG: UDP-N-acetylmuramoyl-tripeptide--D-alanyl-D-alanine ligase [Dehalococcoidia bacterium]|jgi:UDP-N-acetylmuramoyl-tripeptide--D-alanyl-D-alanine ligase